MKAVDVKKKHIEVIEAHLLGDGSLSKEKQDNHNSQFILVQKKSHLDYIEALYVELQFVSLPIKLYTKKDGYEIVQYRTKHLQEFTELRKKWYPNGKKIIPTTLELTPYMIAKWFCDDGSNNHDVGTAVFCTNAYDADSLEILRQQLNRFNIQTTIQKSNVLYVKTESYLVLMNLIKPFLPLSFAYKGKISKKFLNRRKRKTNWKFYSPEGKLYNITNLTAFGKEHKLLISGLSNVVSGRVPHYKGWTLCTK